jgi:hypothetical protein
MKHFVISSLLLLSSHSAIAGLIDFADTTDSGWYQQNIQTSDYQFDKDMGWMGTNSYSSWLPAGADNNTQDIEMGFGSFTLTRQDGNSFDLMSLDAGLSWYNYDLVDELTITGYGNSGTVTTNFSLTHDYQSFDLNGFLDLDFVTFSGNAIDTGYIALDNLLVMPSLTASNLPPISGNPVAAPTSVPEPMMLPLFLAGLLGLFKFTRLSPGTCT